LFGVQYLDDAAGVDRQGRFVRSVQCLSAPSTACGLPPRSSLGGLSYSSCLAFEAPGSVRRKRPSMPRRGNCRPCRPRRKTSGNLPSLASLPSSCRRSAARGEGRRRRVTRSGFCVRSVRSVRNDRSRIAKEQASPKRQASRSAPPPVRQATFWLGPPGGGRAGQVDNGGRRFRGPETLVRLVRLVRSRPTYPKCPARRPSQGGALREHSNCQGTGSDRDRCLCRHAAQRFRTIGIASAFRREKSRGGA